MRLASRESRERTRVSPSSAIMWSSRIHRGLFVLTHHADCLLACIDASKSRSTCANVAAPIPCHLNRKEAE